MTGQGRAIAALAAAALLGVVASRSANAQSGRTGRVWIRAAVVGQGSAVVPVPLFVLQLLSTSDTVIRFGLRTSLDGIATVEVSPGRYRLVSTVPAVLGDRRYRWNVAVELVGGDSVSVALTDANANVEEIATSHPGLPVSKPRLTDRGAVRLAGWGVFGSSKSANRDPSDEYITGNRFRRTEAGISGSADYFVARRIALGLHLLVSRTWTGDRYESSSGSQHTEGLLEYGPQATLFPLTRGSLILPYLQVRAVRIRETYSPPVFSVCTAGFGCSQSTESAIYSSNDLRGAVGALLVFAPQVAMDVAVEYSRVRDSGPELSSKGRTVALRIGLALFFRPSAGQGRGDREPLAGQAGHGTGRLERQP